MCDILKRGKIKSRLLFRADQRLPKQNMLDVNKMTGVEVRGWKLESILGNGADGIVYRGKRDNEIVAVKIFFPDAIKKNGEEEAKARLDLQLSLKGKKHHPNLVEVYDGGFDDDLGVLYLIMEHVPGRSLDKLIHLLPRESIPALFLQLCAAANFLESQDLHHRDIKPANVVVSDDFKQLTLLDLGIILKTPVSNQEDRLSGDEFVATLRYSPPEFVWRTENSTDPLAWRAITFYQLGATLHDMLMREPMFSRFDVPRATLYDSVKLRTPIIDVADCPNWLMRVAKCCLLKDWRQRLELVSWERLTNTGETAPQESIRTHVRLKQILHDENKTLEHHAQQPKQSDRGKELWTLQDRLFLEIRQYLLDDSLFPKFSAFHKRLSDHSYELTFDFETDDSRLFPEILRVLVALKTNDSIQAKTDLHFLASTESRGTLYAAEWSELLTVEIAAPLCQAAILQAVNKFTD